MCIRDSRNTLVYRLEKIKKITGLDLREFEDAIVFKVALMVKKYFCLLYTSHAHRPDGGEVPRCI